MVGIINVDEKRLRPLTAGNLPGTHLMLVGEIRLYNAAQLTTLLQLKAPQNNQQLLLEAYKKWGANCVNYLNGDYSFVIWDAQLNEIFAARDHIGVIPFYYAFDSVQFIFSSKFEYVSENLQTAKTINTDWVLYFLLDRQKDRVQTVYNQINRLAPGHYLTIKNNKLTTHQYWNLEDTQPITSITQDEAIYGLRTRVENAVKTRIGNADKIGVELSGGLDSSAIAAFANKYALPGSLTAYTNVLPEADKKAYPDFYDEWSKAAKVAAQCGIKQHIPIEAPVANTITLIDTLLEKHGQPSITYFTVLQQSIFNQAAALNNQVLFCGFGGDELVSERAVKCYITTVWKSKGFIGLVQMYRKQGYSFIKAIYTGSRFVQGRVSKQEEKYRKVLFAKKWKNVLIKEDLITKHNLKTQFWTRFYYPVGQTLKERSLYHIRKNTLVERLETGYSVTAGSDFSYVFPLFDKELLEYYYSLPDVLKGNHRNSRFLFREVCKDVLPQDIVQQNKPSNAYTVPFVKKQAINEMQELIDYILAIPSNSKMYNYVDKNKLQKWLQSIATNNGEIWQFKTIVNIIVLERFLNKT